MFSSKKREPINMTKPIEVAPELFIEVLSPSNHRRNMGEKLDVYSRIGVRECWIVDPIELKIEVLRLTGEGPILANVSYRGETVKSIYWPGLELQVDSIFTVRTSMTHYYTDWPSTESRSSVSRTKSIVS